MKMHLTLLLAACLLCPQLALCEDDQAKVEDFIESESPPTDDRPLEEGDMPPLTDDEDHHQVPEQPSPAEDYLDYISNGGQLPEEDSLEENPFQTPDNQDLPQNQMEDDGTGPYDPTAHEDYPYDEDLPNDEHGLTIKGMLFTHYQKFSNKTETEKKLMLAEMIPQFDTDQDGLVSLAELKAWVVAEAVREISGTDPEEFGWSQVDADKDGKVSEQETKSDLVRQMDGSDVSEKEGRYEALRFRHGDRNGDGYLEKGEEYIRYIMPDSFLDMRDFAIEHYIHEFDQDEDKKISREEYVSNSMFQTEESEQSQEMKRYEEERFHSFDTDGNGSLDGRELEGAALEHASITTVNRELRRMFEVMNEDGDDQLSREELMKHYELLTTDADRQELVPPQGHPEMMGGSHQELMEESEGAPEEDMGSEEELADQSPPPPEMMTQGGEKTRDEL